MHFDRLHFGGQIHRRKRDDGSGFYYAGFDSSYGNGSNTADLVDVLKRKTQGLVRGTRGRENGIQRLKEGFSGRVSIFSFDSPALVPGHLFAGFYHVVAVPTGDRDKGHGFGIVADFFDVTADFFLDFFEASLEGRNAYNVDVGFDFFTWE